MILLRPVFSQVKLLLKRKPAVLTFAVLMAVVLLYFIRDVNVYRGLDIKELFQPAKMLLLSYAKGDVYFYYFVLVLPLVVSLPAGLSYAADEDMAVDSAVIGRMGRKQYLFTRLIAVFIVTAVVFSLPFLIELLLNALSFPLDATGEYPMFSMFDPQLAEFAEKMYMTDLFYRSAWLYSIMWIIIFGLFCGAMACFTFAISTVIKLKYGVFYIIPVFLILNLSYGSSLKWFDYVTVYNYAQGKNLLAFLIVLTLIIVLTLVLIMISARRDTLRRGSIHLDDFVLKKTVLPIAVIACGLIAASDALVFYGKTPNTSQIIYAISAFSAPSMGTRITIADVFLLVHRLIPMFIFQAAAGTSLYRHYCSSSVYIFSRITNRSKWYLGEVLRLFGKALLCSLIYAAVYIAVGGIRYGLSFEPYSIYLLIMQVLLYAFWGLVMALLMNIIAIKTGSSAAYSVLVSLQVLMIVLLLVVNRYAPEIGTATAEETARMSLVARANPISCIILGWQQSRLDLGGAFYVTRFERLYLEDSLMIVLVFSLVVIFVGQKIIKRHDLLLADAEVGGV